MLGIFQKLIHIGKFLTYVFVEWMPEENTLETKGTGKQSQEWTKHQGVPLNRADKKINLFYKNKNNNICLN